MKKCTIFTEKQMINSKVEPTIFGSFLEHLGRAIYTGIYDENHPKSNKDGMRMDVAEAVKDMGVSIVRYPGGNFVSNYNWRDGIGPKENRPKRLELHWQSVEPNQFGTDEFMKWCELVNTSPMMAVNLGSGTIKQAQELVEYCNHEYDTELSEERIRNGSRKPYGVKYWCLGNEVDGCWQAGHMSAIDYAKKAYEAAKLMKWTDETIKVVACGSSSCDMPTFPNWDREVLEYGYDQFDYISMHEYDWPQTNDLDYFASYYKMNKYINTIKTTINYVKAVKRTDKDVFISFDEWNVGDQSLPKKGNWEIAPSLFEQKYTLKDALVMGGMLNTLINNSDVVKIACLAQLVNVVAPIITDKTDGILKQAIYIPFSLASKYASNGTSMRQIISSPTFESRYGEVNYISSSIVVFDDAINILVANYSDEDTELEVKLDSFENLEAIEHLTLDGPDLKITNTFDHPNRVKMRNLDLPVVDGNKVNVTLPKLSWNVIRIKRN